MLIRKKVSNPIAKKWIETELVKKRLGSEKIATKTKR